MPFSKFQFHPQVAAGVATLGYEAPTPIQAQSIPPVMEGRDVLGLAQTGTGKTAAFVLPMLHRLIDGKRGTLRALVIAPTRELAEQTHDFIEQLAPYTGIRSTTIYGGVGMQPQIDRLRRGVDVVVACPGRLLDHLAQKTVSLATLQILVLDEADRMFDMGFLPDVRRVLAFVPKQRQTLLYSATMPDDIRHLVREVLTDEVTVQIGHAAPAETVEHALYPVPGHLKTPLLFELLKRTSTDSVLVFTRTKHRAKKVARQLNAAGYRAAELQGNLSQNRRQAALDGFRDGTYKILVATDIAARGIDVSLISHVINYDIPDTTDAYTHRIGRTGRAARTGEAYTFVEPDDEPTVRAIERVLKARIERRTLPHFDYHAPVPPREPRAPRPERRPRPSPHAQPVAAQAAPASHHPHAGELRNPQPRPAAAVAANGERRSRRRRRGGRGRNRGGQAAAAPAGLPQAQARHEHRRDAQPAREGRGDRRAQPPRRPEKKTYITAPVQRGTMRIRSVIPQDLDFTPLED